MIFYKENFLKNEKTKYQLWIEILESFPLRMVQKPLCPRTLDWSKSSRRSLFVLVIVTPRVQGDPLVRQVVCLVSGQANRL